MKKVTMIMVVALLTVFVLTTLAFAGNVSDAKEYMKDGMLLQAVVLLEKEIVDNPTKAEAHYLLGDCYVQQNKLSLAKERFDSAVRFNAKKYGYKIGIIPKRHALESARKDDLVQFSKLAEFAKEYDPSLRKPIARELFNLGKIKESKNLFVIASSKAYDETLKPEIGDFYWGLHKMAVGEQALIYKGEACYFDTRYCPDFKMSAEQQANADLEYAKDQAKRPGAEHEKMRARYKSSAIYWYNKAGLDGKAILERKLPETVKYMPHSETYDFPLKAGEQASNWIKIGAFSSRFLAENDCHFYIIYKDGYIAKEGETRSMGMAIDFKFVATTNCIRNGGISLVVK